jgi:hypothetical protein
MAKQPNFSHSPESCHQAGPVRRLEKDVESLEERTVDLPAIAIQLATVVTKIDEVATLMRDQAIAATQIQALAKSEDLQWIEIKEIRKDLEAAKSAPGKLAIKGWTLLGGFLSGIFSAVIIAWLVTS